MVEHISGPTIKALGKMGEAQARRMKEIEEQSEILFKQVKSLEEALAETERMWSKEKSRAEWWRKQSLRSLHEI